MSAAQGDSQGTKNVSFQVDVETLDEFDRTVKQLQIDGGVPMGASRSDVLRHLVERAINDPDVLSEGAEE